MSAERCDSLPVPGASLYYEVRGSGPTLLMIHGGAEDADGFKFIANQLADSYTVVTYDRRGYSRSRLDDKAEEQNLATQSDDAHRLLAALCTDPAYVFGNSAGAFIGLDLVARHPEQVRLLIAHEPPLRQLLPDPEQFLISDKILETYRHEGERSALRQFATCAGIVAGEWEPDVTPPQRSPLSAGNSEFFLTKEASEIERYVFDLPALKAAATRIVPAGGSDSRGYFTFRCAAALADVLGTSVAEFPSHHAGYRNMPRAFARRLREVLDA